MKDIRNTVLTQMERVGREQKRTMPALTESTALVDSGLDSLCMAIIVARLDDELGVDPFDVDDVPFPVTIGDFIKLYDKANVR